MDILFVTPPSRAQVYQNLSNDFAAVEPPVWSGLMAHYMQRLDYEVAILDAEAEGLTPDQTARRIADAAPRLTVFVIYGQQPSASTQCMLGGRKVALALATLAYDGATIVMGTHASALPQRTLHEEPYTYVCDGEGPHTLQALIKHLEGELPIVSVPGLWYRDGYQARSNAGAPLIDDLDNTLPRQAWEMLDMSRYRAHNWHCFGDLSSRGSYASLQTSLGCPFKCNFCCINSPFGTAAIRYWSVDNVLSQIKSLVTQFGVRNIKIPDEMFVLNPKRVIEMCDRIISSGYTLNIWAYARVDTVNNPMMLKKLKQAGFHWLALGIESGSKHVRDGVTKGRFGNLDIIANVNKVRDAGINVIGNYIFGLPDDTHESMQETLDLAKELNCEWGNFYSAMAYPGSPLYETARQKGWALPDDPGGPGWIGYSQHSFDCLPLPTESLSALEVLDFRDKAFTEYFTNPVYLQMLERKFGSEATAHVRAMTTIELPRRHRLSQERKLA